MNESKAAWKQSSYDPSDTALLLLDYENAHLGLISQDSNDETRKKVEQSVQALLEAARKNGVAIIHCLLDTESDPYPTSKGIEMWQSVLKPHIAANPDMVAEFKGFVLTPETTGSAAPSGRETTFHRNPARRSALTPDILSLLREKLGIKHLVMCGIQTSGPVLGTATHATDLDFVVTVVRDGCFDMDEEVHRVLLDKVLKERAWISSVEEAVGFMTGSDEE